MAQHLNNIASLNSRLLLAVPELVRKDARPKDLLPPPTIILVAKKAMTIEIPIAMKRRAKLRRILLKMIPLKVLGKALLRSIHSLRREMFFDIEA